MVMGQVGEGRICAVGQGLGAPVGGMSEGGTPGRVRAGRAQGLGWEGKARPGDPNCLAVPRSCPGDQKTRSPQLASSLPQFLHPEDREPDAGRLQLCLLTTRSLI